MMKTVKRMSQKSGILRINQREKSQKRRRKRKKRETRKKIS